jgi:spore germination cell wall hydrolase CwlJ-like protein
LSTLTPEQRDAIIKTIYGEARGEPEKGMRAVAHVIKNRTADYRWPKDPEEVVKQRLQFSSWNTNDPNYAKIQALSPNNTFYQTIGHIVDEVWAGEADLTKGAVYYYAPAGMPGRKAPSWWPTAVAESGGQIQIGGQFFAGKVHTTKPSVVIRTKTSKKA